MTVITNSDAMAHYRLAVIKGRLTLESKGLQGRGGAMRPRMAKEFGLSPRAPFEDFIAVAQKRMAELEEKECRQMEVDHDLWAERRAEEQDKLDRLNDHD